MPEAEDVSEKHLGIKTAEDILIAFFKTIINYQDTDSKLLLLLLN